jgi:hypothetical protein
MMLAHLLSERMKNDTEVTGDLAIFVAELDGKPTALPGPSLRLSSIPASRLQSMRTRWTAGVGGSDLAYGAWTYRWCRDTARLIALLVLFVLPLAGPLIAQDGPVDCGNGFHCPEDNACLLDGFCAVGIDLLPGSVPSSSMPGLYL